MSNPVKEVIDGAPEYRPKPVDMKEAKVTQKEALLIVADAAKVWRTPEGETYATVPVGEHAEHYAVGSKTFRDWLLSEMARQYETGGRPASASGNVLRDAVAAIEARGFSNPERHKAALRVIEHGDATYIDLGDADWRAVQVREGGWRIVDRPPVPIIRTRKTATFPYPTKPGSFNPLRAALVHLGDNDFILFVAWALGALAATGPYPILIFGGEAGSGKSTFARVGRRLTDPTTGDLLQPPGDVRDLIAHAKQNRTLAFDNLSKLPSDLADGLCRIATGGELGGRALFTDNDSAAFSASRPIILNGIPDLASRGDLASRAVVIHLPPIDARRTEAEINAVILAAMAPAFGALLTALAVGLKNLGATPTPNVRMSDWARLVVAAEPALPWPAGGFLAALGANASNASASIVEGDLVASAVRDHARRHPGGWSGLVSELLTQTTAALDPDVRKAGDWPGNPKWFSERLTRAIPALRSVGVNVSTKRTAAGVKVRLECLAALATRPVSNADVFPSARVANVANVASPLVYEL